MVCPHFPARHALPRTMGLLNPLLSSQIRLVFFVCLFLRVRKKIKAFAKDTGCSENLLCLHLIFPVFFTATDIYKLWGHPHTCAQDPIKPPKTNLCLNSTKSSLKHCPTKAGAHIKRGTNVAKARGCTGATEHRRGAAAELPPSNRHEWGAISNFLMVRQKHVLLLLSWVYCEH